MLSLSPLFRYTPRRSLFSQPLRLLMLLLVLLSVVLLFSGCTLFKPAASTTGAPPTALQTFDALYSDALTAETLAVSTATAAVNSRLISAVQGQMVLNVTDSVKRVLDAANAAAQAGNSAVATTNLALAVGTIATVSACLTAKPLTVATFAACTARLSAPAVQA